MKKTFTLLFFLHLMIGVFAQDPFSSQMLLLSNSNFVDGVPYKVVDFDGDGNLDIVGGKLGTVYLNDGNTNFTVSGGTGEPYREAGDMDGDGLIDIVGEETVHFNNGDGTFSGFVLPEPGAQYLLDFDNDGDLDLITEEENFSNPSMLSIIINHGNGSFENAGLLNEGNVNNYFGITTADFNGDNFTDIATNPALGATMEIYFSNGDGTFNLATVPTNPTRGLLQSADLDNDGDLDLIHAGFNNVVYHYNTNGSFGAAQDFPVPFQNNAYVKGLDIADLNDDGLADMSLILIEGTDFQVRTYFNDGAGSFDSPFTIFEDDFFIGGNVISVFRSQIVDIDQDGKRDVLTQTGSRINWAKNEVTVNVFSVNPEIAIKAFPNPFLNQVTIDAPSLSGEKVSIDIRNINGQLVKTVKETLPATITGLRGLAAGHYTINVVAAESGKLLATGHLVK